MESIDQIRQMMAEHKFYEAQIALETQLAFQDVHMRPQLLQLLYDVLLLQKRKPPFVIIRELLENYTSQKKWQIVSELLDQIDDKDFAVNFHFIMNVKIEMAEYSGHLELLQELCNEVLLFQIENQKPIIPVNLNKLINKFFKNDFTLKLKMLSIYLILQDENGSELLLQELILSCIEKASPKGIVDKLQAILEVLKLNHNKGKLEIYKNLCGIWSEGVKSKSDYKKLVEMIIYFDDFKFQIIVMHLLHRWGLQSEAQEYATSIKKSHGYNFVYLDKYFQELKGYFVSLPKTEPTKEESVVIPDLTISEIKDSEIFVNNDFVKSEDVESPYIFLLKHQSYSFGQLCDLAVSFLQSEMPKVTVVACVRAQTQSESDAEYLKASYLKITALLQLQDLRAALDECLSSLGKAKSEEDILSFMYAQAEIYLRLGEFDQARLMYKRIINMDAQYRLAREKLDKLNEI